MPKAETNEIQAGTPQKSRLLDSDAPAPAAPAQQTQTDEPQYLVDGQRVSREAYLEALPRAGFIPERMPANYYPAISTK